MLTAIDSHLDKNNVEARCEAARQGIRREMDGLGIYKGINSSADVSAGIEG
tara:strand:- start:337 stop:489 length:153 start_codon:yes stop_codon:yes gene_type:complete